MHQPQTDDLMPAKLLKWTSLCFQKEVLVGFGYDFQESNLSRPTKHFSSQQTVHLH